MVTYPVNIYLVIQGVVINTLFKKKSEASCANILSVWILWEDIKRH